MCVNLNERCFVAVAGPTGRTRIDEETEQKQKVVWRIRADMLMVRIIEL